MENQNSHFVKQNMSASEFRKSLSVYVADNIEYTFTSSHRHDRNLDYTRHYYSHKLAKDFILHTKKDLFTLDEIKEYFEKNIILNYLNDLGVNIID